MKKCSKCQGKTRELKSTTPEGFEYSYDKCLKCGEEMLDMKQLHQVAQKYREMKRYKAKITPWGKSLGIRIPKELAKEYNLKDEVTLIADKEGIRIIA